MRCKHCGAEIVRIHTMGGPAVCWASPITYWPVRDSEARGLLTRNGSSVYGNLTGNLQDAVGVGYLLHTCRTEPEKAELAAALASDIVIYGRMYGLISEE